MNHSDVPRSPLCYLITSFCNRAPDQKVVELWDKNQSFWFIRYMFIVWFHGTPFKLGLFTLVRYLIFICTALIWHSKAIKASLAEGGLAHTWLYHFVTKATMWALRNSIFLSSSVFCLNQWPTFTGETSWLQDDCEEIKTPECPAGYVYIMTHLQEHFLILLLICAGLCARPSSCCQWMDSEPHTWKEEAPLFPTSRNSVRTSYKNVNN